MDTKLCFIVRTLEEWKKGRRPWCKRYTAYTVEDALKVVQDLLLEGKNVRILRVELG